MVENSAGEFRYWAFLSYSHKDTAAARTLHRRLETYRIPARLAGTGTALGPVPDRLWPIFRDRDELPAATDLSETVRRALDQSGALIILCSPDAAQSLWVAEEIRTFRGLHPDRPILAAILSGSPPDCFPSELRLVDAQGVTHEPLATDLRPGGDGAQVGLLKLIAGITGLGLDDLVQRDAARRIRSVTAVTVGALVAMLIMAALTVIALNARAEAERQRAEAEGQIEFMLTDLRETLKGVGRVDVLEVVNRRALAHYSRQGDLRRLPADSLARRARILHAVGEDYLTHQQIRLASTALNQAADTTAEQLRRDPDNPDRIFDHSQSEFWLGRIHYDQAHFQDARPAFERYRRLTERLVAQNPRNALWVQEAGYAAGNLCSIALGDPVDAAAAVRLCGAAVQRMEQVAALRRNDPGAMVDLANRYGWMVDALNANGQWDDARRYRSRHEELVQRLIRSDSRNLDYQDIWMRSQFGFGRLLVAHGDREEARRRFADAATTARLLCRRDPHNESWCSFRRRIATALAQIDEER